MGTLRTPAEVGRIVRSRRSDLGLSQVAAAQKAGLSTPTWGKLEAGDKTTQSSRRSAMLALGWGIESFDRLIVGDDPDTIGTTELEPVSTSDALNQIELILRKTGLDPQRIEIAMSVVRSLLD